MYKTNVKKDIMIPFCPRCGIQYYGEPFESHHIIPLAILKKHHIVIPSNKILVCHDCHKLIHKKVVPPKTIWYEIEDRISKAKSSQRLVKIRNYYFKITIEDYNFAKTL